jgi:competence protein ComGC
MGCAKSKRLLLLLLLLQLLLLLVLLNWPVPSVCKQRAHLQQQGVHYL